MDFARRVEETTCEFTIVAHGWIAHAMLRQSTTFGVNLKGCLQIPKGTSDKVTR